MNATGSQNGQSSHLKDLIRIIHTGDYCRQLLHIPGLRSIGASAVLALGYNSCHILSVETGRILNSEKLPEDFRGNWEKYTLASPLTFVSLYLGSIYVIRVLRPCGFDFQILKCGGLEDVQDEMVDFDIFPEEQEGHCRHGRIVLLSRSGRLREMDLDFNVPLDLKMTGCETQSKRGLARLHTGFLRRLTRNEWATVHCELDSGAQLATVRVFDLSIRGEARLVNEVPIAIHKSLASSVKTCVDCVTVNWERRELLLGCTNGDVYIVFVDSKGSLETTQTIPSIGNAGLHCVCALQGHSVYYGAVGKQVVTYNNGRVSTVGIIPGRDIDDGTDIIATDSDHVLVLTGGGDIAVFVTG